MLSPYLYLSSLQTLHTFPTLSLSVPLSLCLARFQGELRNICYLDNFTHQFIIISLSFFSFFIFGLYATLHNIFMDIIWETSNSPQFFLFYLYGTKKPIDVQVLLHYREKCIGLSHFFNGCPSSSWFFLSRIFLVSLFINSKFRRYSSLFSFLSLSLSLNFNMNERFLVKLGPEYKNFKLNNYNVLKQKKQAHQY